MYMNLILNLSSTQNALKSENFKTSCHMLTVPKRINCAHFFSEKKKRFRHKKVNNAFLVLQLFE